ncbi:DUF4260 domain-containing protein [Mesorhizobium sp. BR1-1-16]|uniref:DUF4260 domain-containing protein n=1 Tax=Mesorhizobium sp. BR1-1-16 TaxID=2876653 RepID=UPI001CCD0DB3|nr:DUF4260 domain-containing protein [Mesorhizobium sp. BR1-1-16]MBZ9936484.1 DUF4260 domain-containing protein [Mesorhizobium sp. BR1-1-16]
MPTANPSFSPAVAGIPRRLLQAEGAALLAAVVIAYAYLGGNWIVFAALFLAPDLAMLGYLGGNRVGAALYNAVHTTLAAFALGAAGYLLGAGWAIDGALILAAHIGFDRMLGYGLKYGTAFGDTHLGSKGKRP